MSVNLQVSVLIPTYNQEQWVDRAIESALMQNFHSFEVVVMDDFSSDGTENIVKKWIKDSRFRYVRNSKNSGRVKNYRKALYEEARGKWIVMLDGDDFFTNQNYLNKCWEITKINKNESIMFVQFGHRVRYLEKSKKDILVLPKIKDDTLSLSGSDYIKFVYRTGFFSHLGVFFNREYALQYNCYENDISSSDMHSFLSLSLEGKVILCKEVAGCWFQHSANTSSNLPVHRIVENTVIFRNIANLAIRKGLSSKLRLNFWLTRYEARTLASLYKNCIKNSPSGITGVWQIVDIAFKINPVILLNFKIIKILILSFAFSRLKIIKIFIKKYNESRN